MAKIAVAPLVGARIEIEKEKVTGGKYKSVKYEDFVCQKVTKVQIRQSENDIGAVYPDTEITENDNSYILQDNFLVYGMGADALETVARNLYEVIKVVKYRPYNCEKIGNPCLSLGEAVNVYTAKEIIESYVLSRTYKGIQQPIDTISATGKAPKYSEQVNGINKSIIQLRGKTNELERNVEETRSEIKDVESGLDTKITQTAGKIELEAKRATDAEVELAAAISVQADQIKLKVSKGDVSSQLSIENGQVKISGNRFVLESDNCSISADGTITASNAVLNGSIKSVGEDGNYTEVSSGEIKFYNEQVQSTGSIRGLGESLVIDGASVSVTGMLIVGNGATHLSQSYVKSIATTTGSFLSKNVITNSTLTVTRNFTTGNVTDVKINNQTALVADYPGYGTTFVKTITPTGGFLSVSAGIVTSFS